MHRIPLAVSLVAALALGGCSKNDEPSAPPAADDTSAAGGPEHGKTAEPPPHAGTMTPPHAGMPGMAGENGAASAVSPTAEDGTKDFGPFTVKVPKTWGETAPSSSMRAAQFTIGGEESKPAELVVYYFGEGGAGGVEANLDRWYGQFEQEDGKSTREVAKTEKTEVSGMPVTKVFVTGRYVAAMQPGSAEKNDQPGQAMLGAIVETDKGPYYFKMIGPEATVQAARSEFDAFIGSLTAKD